MNTLVRTHFVRMGKRTMWLLAVLLTLALIATAWIKSGDGGRIVLGGGNGKGQPAAMLRPHYQGLDSRNRPFNITADQATQPDTDTVVMQRVNADMSLSDESWVSANADQGVYHIFSKQMTLTGHVDLFYDNYEFRTEEMQIDVAGSTAWGDKPVEGQGPSGILRANRFKILDRGAILVFNERVHVTLYMH